MKAPAYVIEHGQTAMDKRGLVHGPAHAAEPLDREGRRQAVALGARLRALKPGRIYTSPARRAQMTGAIAGAVAGVPVEAAAELASLDAGTLGQGNQIEVARRLKPYFAHPERPIPGGETVKAWRARHLDFMRRVAARALQRGERPPAFVTHSNVVGSALAAARGGSADAGRQAMATPPPPAVAHQVSFSAGPGPRKP
ncbi:MAG TPA: histidine phosphatase family protein [Terriglobales bacterium]|nr:histidine phosphatase family protein [Terriglobales bacterium]